MAILATAVKACPKIYLPVCASVNGMHMTFANECEMNNYGGQDTGNCRSLLFRCI